ncbi:hypothetical protein GUJ93_ZPchr0585g33751 [Zizania palustris]|uniref:Uncharacterized protein n=1 Tax=Zizania palustris TaxID=103762 RepID=A0A8J5RQ46_ZIZPA|nr:hypothetical protein GUJ93_ZPchr0585g33751 [Zizania palustris]
MTGVGGYVTKPQVPPLVSSPAPETPVTTSGRRLHRRRSLVLTRGTISSPWTRGCPPLPPTTTRSSRNRKTKSMSLPRHCALPVPSTGSRTDATGGV